MSRRPRLAKSALVSEIDHQLDIGPNVVRTDDDLLSVAQAAFSHPETRLLAVVDEEGRVQGVIPVLRVVEEIVAHASPEALMASVIDIESVVRFAREVSSKVAGDLMSPPIVLRADSTVADAFRAMHDHRYSGLPIVDDEQRVTGYIDLLELALRYLEDVAAPVGPPRPEEQPP